MEYKDATEIQRSIEEVAVAREELKRKDAEVEQLIEPSRPVRIRIGGAPIHVTMVEFRILQFLSRKPYKPFTPEQIVEWVNQPDSEVDEQTLADHIKTLRDKLGIFSDFVQSVPYIGYRFKP